MKLSPETLEYQKSLADYCKTGVLKDIPGVTPNRVHHYRRLVTNILYDTLETSYPIAYEILSEAEWRMLVDDFFVNYKIATPQVWKMPLEFYEYVKLSGYAERLDRPYLNDLLLFEWVETDVYTMEDIEPSPYTSEGTLENSILVLNPEYQLLQLEYPVHMCKQDDLATSKGNYIVLVFRDLDEKRVHFVNLGLFPVLVIESIDNGFRLEEAIKLASEKLNLPYSDDHKLQMLEILKDLQQKKFVLGFRL